MGRREFLGLGGGLALTAFVSRSAASSWPDPAVSQPPAWNTLPGTDPTKAPLSLFGRTVAPYGDLNAGKVKFRNHLTPGASLSELDWGPGRDLVIAFGACPNSTPATVTPLVAANPTMFFMLGDFVYRDDGSPSYKRALRVPNRVLWQHYPIWAQTTYNYDWFFGSTRNSGPWQSLASSTFIYGVQDDHDYGADGIVGGRLFQMPTQYEPDAWYAARQLEWNRRVIATNTSFRKFMPQPGDQNVNAPTYHAFTVPGADVRFLCLDCRRYADHHALAGNGTSFPAFLGQAQWTWFLNEYLAATESLVVVISPMAPSFVLGSTGGNQIDAKSYDLWVRTLLRRQGRTLIAAGDRHASGLARLGLSTYEFLCAPMGTDARHTIGVPRSPATLLWSNATKTTRAPIDDACFGLIRVTPGGGVTIEAVRADESRILMDARDGRGLQPSIRLFDDTSDRHHRLLRHVLD